MNPGIDVGSPGGVTMEVIDPFSHTIRFCEITLRTESGQSTARPADNRFVNLDTKIMALVDQHIDRLEEDGRAVRTIDTYRYCAKLLGKIMAGVRVGEATTSWHPTRFATSRRTDRRRS